LLQTPDETAIETPQQTPPETPIETAREIVEQPDLSGDDETLDAQLTDGAEPCTPAFEKSAVVDAGPTCKSCTAAYVVGAVGFAVGAIATAITVYKLTRECKFKCKQPQSSSWEDSDSGEFQAAIIETK
jgi:hypothetical protein